MAEQYMPLPFRHVCDLLELLHDFIEDRNDFRSREAVCNWFKQHRDKIDACNPICLLSTIVPSKRTDRVYLIQLRTLEGIIQEALGISVSRLHNLQRYRSPNSGCDLGDCVEAILRVTPNPTYGDDVTVEEIDTILHTVASHCRWSSANVRRSAKSNREINKTKLLSDLYRRLSPKDAKWFTRLVLKDFGPASPVPNVVFRAFDPLLPKAFLLRDNFAEAINLSRELKALKVARHFTRDDRILDLAAPLIGVKVGRPTWLKGRTIKHCLKMGKGKMSVEQKMDGEYCQIHVNLHSKHRIQIFSKSGKDSTYDRVGVHHSIKKALQIDSQNCPIQQCCILEGELLVYSNKEQNILGFDEIRKHVTRSGVALNTNQDLLPDPGDHLMIVYYDVLLVDGVSFLNKKHSERFERLQTLITVLEGEAHLVHREIVDFSQPDAADQLTHIFASCIASKGEGLVIKPDEPYFDFSWPPVRQYCSCIIKLKKEYSRYFGDVGDFGVVAAYYDSRRAAELVPQRVKWTHFLIACLQHPCPPDDFCNAKFLVTNVVTLNEANHKVLANMAVDAAPYLDREAGHVRIPYAMSTIKPQVVFHPPLVFDVRSYAFDKPGNFGGRWAPRFPEVTKIHFDRSWQDILTYEELEEKAIQATTLNDEDDSSQETRKMLEVLKKMESGSPALSQALQNSLHPSDTTSEIIIATPRTVTENDHSIKATPRPSISEVQLTTPASRHTSNNRCPPISTSTESKRCSPSLFSLDSPLGRDSESFTPITPSTKRKRTRSCDGNGICRKQMRPQDAPSQSFVVEQNAKHKVQMKTLESVSYTHPLDKASTTSLPVQGSADAVCKHSTATLQMQTTLKGKSSEPERAQSPTAGSNSFICARCKKDCILFGSLVALAPAMGENIQRITRLLHAHGAHRVIVEKDDATTAAAFTTALEHEQSRDVSTSGEASSSRPRPGQTARLVNSASLGRRQRLCLVNGRQDEATTKSFFDAFAESKRTAKSKRGRRIGWIPTYHWRLVEDLDNVDGHLNYDPLRKWRIGLA